MQATIYITPEAMATVSAIKDLDYYDRVTLSEDDATNLTMKEGYHLIAKKLKLTPLPEDANVAASLNPATPAGHGTVSMPAHLRGCIFEHAPRLPDGYASIIEYWSGAPWCTDAVGAAHYQCPQNEYMVKFPTDADGSPARAGAAVDRLLSEGVVVAIIGVGALVASMQPDDFIEISLPVDAAMLGVEPDDFMSINEYGVSRAQRRERIFLKVADVQSSPDADSIFIDVLRHELLDYGYFY